MRVDFRPQIAIERIAKPVMPIVVCPVQISQIPDLLRLLRAKAAFDGAEHSLRATAANLAQELFRAQAKAHAMVATLDQQVVGMATYFATFSSFLMAPGIWLDNLYVDSAFRQHGVGQQLITRLWQEAVAHGCQRVDWMVEAGNANGLAFYRRKGGYDFRALAFGVDGRGVYWCAGCGT